MFGAGAPKTRFTFERARRGLVGHCGAHGPATDDASQTHTAHHARHGAARDIEAFTHHLTPDLPHAAKLEVLGEHAGDRQHFADRLDPMDLMVISDESDHRLNGRSSSACAKYALALRRISLA